MWAVIVVIAAGAIIFAIETPVIIKNRAWGELAVFCATLLSGMVLLICMFVEIEIPNPLDSIRMIYEPIGKSLRGE